MDEPQAALTLEPANVGAQTPLAWQTWPIGATARVRHREVTITGLSARKRYEFELQANGHEVASIELTTLPAELPLLGDKPFTVLLGSCFAHLEDQERKVGNAIFHMPRSASPEIKLLAGDQVYLDSPWWWYLVQHSNDTLRDTFLKHYLDTWGQDRGFARLLANGANFFCSDDHEFWNNAPDRGVYAADTWQQTGRQFWWRTAAELYRAFQTPRPMLQFAVPPLSFLIADTRIHRDSDQQNFMDRADLGAVEQWVTSLPGPGVLVIGQPLLWNTSSFLKGSFTDWNLPDYEQYHQLVEIVGKSPHALTILTGDVHFGRVAHGRLTSGSELIEIISSPLSLVSEKASGEWEQAPPTFPIVRPEQVTPDMLARRAVTTQAHFQPTDRHFLTLEFTRRGPGAQLKLRYWPVFTGGMPPPDFGKTVWERTLA